MQPKCLERELFVPTLNAGLLYLHVSPPFFLMFRSQQQPNSGAANPEAGLLPDTRFGQWLSQPSIYAGRLRHLRALHARPLVVALDVAVAKQEDPLWLSFSVLRSKSSTGTKQNTAPSSLQEGDERQTRRKWLQVPYPLQREERAG